MYPLLKINRKKILENTQAIFRKANEMGVAITAVTKCAGGNPEVAQAFLDGGAAAIGDSRIDNLKKLSPLHCEKWLIRIPMLSEADEVVAYSDLSLNSEIKTIRRLNEVAQIQDKIHSILLMLDLGDLREGLFIGDGSFLTSSIDELVNASIAKIKAILTEIKAMKHISLRGIATNATCVGATIPLPHSFDAFFKVKEMIESQFEVSCDVISGGNSSAYYMIENGTLPDQITNLRMGDVILFGREPAYYHQYDYLHQDAFILDVEIVEVQRKPTYPVGEIGRNAFGEIPQFTDKGIRKRAICALGRQDTDPEHIFPLDSGISIEGSSSDHLVVDITDASSNIDVGDVISFRCDYVGTLHAATSSYVDKIVID